MKLSEENLILGKDVGRKRHFAKQNLSEEEKLCKNAKELDQAKLVFMVLAYWPK